MSVLLEPPAGVTVTRIGQVADAPALSKQVQTTDEVVDPGKKEPDGGEHVILRVLSDWSASVQVGAGQLAVFPSISTRDWTTTSGGHIISGGSFPEERKRKV